MKRVKSFTVVELVVVLILMSITVTFAFSAIGISKKFLEQFEAKKKQTLEVSKINSLMLNDINNCIVVKKTLNGFACIYPDKVNEYKLSEYSITRESAKMEDIFYFTMTDYKMYFQQKEKFLPDNVLDEISIELEIRDAIKIFSYRKDYGADILIENK